METAYIIVLALAALHACDGACPYGYTKQHRSCYRVSHDANTWTHGKKECEKDGGYLAEITDVDENDFVAKITQPPKNADYPWFEYYYIGGTNTENGHWMWDASNTHVSFTNWRKVPGHQATGCIVLKTSDATWDHIHCNSPTGYVCEHDRT